MFVGYDTWEEPLYKPYENIESVIPCDDVTAYRVNPNFRHLFYKPLISDYFGVYNVPVGSKDLRYPAIQKPVINPFGMGMGTREVTCKADERYLPGTFYSEKLVGEHKSIDTMVVDGLPVFHQSAVAHKAEGFTFDYWELIEDDLEWEVILFVVECMGNYSGMLNIETINNKPIELTLRMSGQFIDLYCSDFVDQIVNIYNNNDVNVVNLEQVTNAYSVPIFVPFLDESRCRGIDIPFVNTIDVDDYNPSGGKRLGYINTKDLQDGLQRREDIKKCYLRS